MANNLHVSYDLYAPGQNYEAVIAKIQSLGAWARIHKSFWYVNSSYSALQAVNFIMPALDSNDSLYVADTTNNDAAWVNILKDVETQIRNNWKK